MEGDVGWVGLALSLIAVVRAPRRSRARSACGSSATSSRRRRARLVQLLIAGAALGLDHRRRRAARPVVAVGGADRRVRRRDRLAARARPARASCRWRSGRTRGRRRSACDRVRDRHVPGRGADDRADRRDDHRQRDEGRASSPRSACATRSRAGATRSRRGSRSGCRPPRRREPLSRGVLRTAISPQIENTRALGIVFLPGAMTGLILAGVDPLDAVLVQLALMYLILGAVVVDLDADRRSAPGGASSPPTTGSSRSPGRPTTRLTHPDSVIARSSLNSTERRRTLQLHAGPVGSAVQPAPQPLRRLRGLSRPPVLFLSCRVPTGMARLLTTLTIASCLLALALVPGSAEARTNIRVGIGDQQAAMFDNPHFQRAKFKRVRYFIPWNVDGQRAASSPRPTRTSAARGAATTAVFLHVSSDDLRIKKAKLPSVSRLQVEGRAHGPVLPQARRAGVRHLERGQPRPPADVPQPDARGLVLPRHVPAGQAPLPLVHGRRARRARPARRRALHAHASTGALSPHLPPPRDASVGIHNYGDVNRKRTRFTRNDHPHVAPRTTARRSSGSPRPAAS